MGRRVWQRGMVAANDGNFSTRLDAQTVLATPTGVSKGSLEPQDLVLCDLEGNTHPPRWGVGGRQGTSEIRLHLNAYRMRPDVRAVVHTHAPYATAWALTGRPLPKGVLEEVELVLGSVPLVPYALTGTWEFARQLNPWIARHDCFLLAQHGAVAFGPDLFTAWYRMEVLDLCCKTLLLTEHSGRPLPRFSAAQLAALHAKKKSQRMPDPREGLPYELWTSDEHPAPEPVPADGVWPEPPAPTMSPFTGEYPILDDLPNFTR
ncbi:MAG: class II aldolase/adducin family protein [Candidatus Sumerlaeia bacterium]|nr:class II aldolase/adducin family protein [Candidatus Sumerlaeia bacterium]